MPTFPHASSPCHRSPVSPAFLSWSLCSPFSSPSLPFLPAPDPFLVAVHPSVRAGLTWNTLTAASSCVSSSSGGSGRPIKDEKKSPAQALQRVKSESRSLRDQDGASEGLALPCPQQALGSGSKGPGARGLGLEPALLPTRHSANPTYFRAVAKHK